MVIASNAGRSWHPAWYENLKAHPDAEVEFMGRRYRVHAEDVLPGPERDRQWRSMARLYPPYYEYQRKTQRPIPVVRLRTVGSS